MAVFFCVVTTIIMIISESKNLCIHALAM